MTDEELKSVGRVIGAFSSGSYEQGFQAGYRAGLEESLNDFCARCNNKGISITDIVDGYIDFIDAKLKEQQP